MNSLDLFVMLSVLIPTQLTEADSLEIWNLNRPMPPGSRLSAVAFGNGQFAVAGSRNGGGIIATSTDGVNWVQSLVVIPGDFADITYANGLFVAVGGISLTGGFIYSSADGVTWFNRHFEDDRYLQGVAYGNGQFVAVGGNLSLTSIDGTNWTPHEAGGGDAIVYGNGIFVAVGITGAITTSSDGVNWTQQSLPTNPLYSIAYNNGQFVAVGGTLNPFPYPPGGAYISKIVTSTNGVNWIDRQPGEQGDILSCVTYGNGHFIAGGSSGTIETSVDGSIWIQRQTNVDDWLSGIAYGNGQFVAVGDAGSIIKSVGANYVGIMRDIDTNLMSLLIRGPSGRDYTIQSSSDLIHWDALTKIANSPFNEIILDRLPADSERLFYRAVSP